MTAPLEPPVHRILTGYFREKAGYRMVRPQGRDDWLLIYTIAGRGDFGCGPAGDRVEERFATSRGDVVLLRPGTRQDYRVHPTGRRWDLLWAHFHPRPEWQPWLAWPAVSAASAGLMRISIENPDERRTVERALRRMNQQASGSHRLSKSMAMNALEEALLWCAKGVLRSADQDPRIEQAAEYLCQHLRDNVSLDELAEVVGLSVSRLTHLFKRQTGLTPQRYYETQRLERARELLELTSLPVGSVAAEVGFDNPFYFTLRFTRHMGKNPRAYRQSHDRTAD